MREESEGYSKLIVLLLQDTVELGDKISCQVQQVMHEFNLETNRTIDIILECMESLLIQKGAGQVMLATESINQIATTCIGLCRELAPNPQLRQHIITSTLGFKLQAELARASSDADCQSIMLVIALLIKADEIVPEDLIQAYFPSCKKVNEYHELYAAFLEQKYANLDKNILGAFKLEMQNKQERD